MGFWRSGKSQDDFNISVVMGKYIVRSLIQLFRWFGPDFVPEVTVEVPNLESSGVNIITVRFLANSWLNSICWSLCDTLESS